MTVAVVEDDDAVLDALQMVLEAQGWTVRAYTTGERFLAATNHEELDCILLDPHLPGVSGAQVMRCLTERGYLVPIVGITARPSSPVTHDLVDAGVSTMLTKPVSAGELLAGIKTAILRAKGASYSPHSP